MYVNYLQDRKCLGYTCLHDSSCGSALVIITNSAILFIKDIPVKVVTKTKKGFAVIVVGGAFWLLDPKSASPIGLPLPVKNVNVERLQPNSHSEYSQVQPQKLVPYRPGRLSFTYKSKKEVLFLLYATDPKLSSNQKMVKLIGEIRGGDLKDLAIGLAILAVIITIANSRGDLAFQPNPHAIVPPHLEWIYGSNSFFDPTQPTKWAKNAFLTPIRAYLNLITFT